MAAGLHLPCVHRPSVGGMRPGRAQSSPRASPFPFLHGNAGVHPGKPSRGVAESQQQGGHGGLRVASSSKLPAHEPPAWRHTQVRPPGGSCRGLSRALVSWPDGGVLQLAVPRGLPLPCPLLPSASPARDHQVQGSCPLGGRARTLPGHCPWTSAPALALWGPALCIRGHCSAFGVPGCLGGLSVRRLVSAHVWVSGS